MWGWGISLCFWVFFPYSHLARENYGESILIFWPCSFLMQHLTKIWFSYSHPFLFSLAQQWSAEDEEEQERERRRRHRQLSSSSDAKQEALSTEQKVPCQVPNRYVHTCTYKRHGEVLCSRNHSVRAMWLKWLLAVIEPGPNCIDFEARWYISVYTCRLSSGFRKLYAIR